MKRVINTSNTCQSGKIEKYEEIVKIAENMVEKYRQEYAKLFARVGADPLSGLREQETLDEIRDGIDFYTKINSFTRKIISEEGGLHEKE